MIEFTTYDIATGELLQTLECSDIYLAEAQCSETVGYVLGHWDSIDHIVRDGEVVLREPPALPAPTAD